MFNSKQLKEKLRMLERDFPVVIYDPFDDSVKPLQSVYHEPPNTFIQSDGNKLYSSASLLECLDSLDKGIPFDANVVSGDDWNYQNIADVSLIDNALVISLDVPPDE